MLACIDLVVWLFNDEVNELFFHVPRFFFFGNNLDAFDQAQRSYLLGLLWVVFMGLVTNHGALEGVDEQVTVFKGHKGSFGFHDHSPENGSEGDGQISSNVLVVTLSLLLILLEKVLALFVKAQINGSFSGIVFEVDTDSIV